MFDVTAKIQELIAMGVSADVAANIAGSMLATLQAEVSKAQEVERASMEKLTGVKAWNGLKLKLDNRDRPTHNQTIALCSGVAIEPANKGLDQNGKPVYWPSQIWIAVEGKAVVNIGWKEGQTLLEAIDGMTPERFRAALEQFCGEAARTAYETERNRLIDADEVIGRKKALAKA